MKAKFVHEVMAVPFTNPRNMPITSNYPLQRIQYEDADKPEDKHEDVSDERIDCDRCGRSTPVNQFIDGVCKKCSEEGYYIDRFDTIHRINSRVHKPEHYT